MKLIQLRKILKVIIDFSDLLLLIENLDLWMANLAGQGLSPSEGPLYLENGWRTVSYEGPNQELIELIEQKKEASIYEDTANNKGYRSFLYECLKKYRINESSENREELKWILVMIRRLLM